MRAMERGSQQCFQTEWTLYVQENEPCLLKHDQTIRLKLRMRDMGGIRSIFSKLAGRYIQTTALHVYGMGS